MVPLSVVTFGGKTGGGAESYYVPLTSNGGGDVLPRPPKTKPLLLTAFNILSQTCCGEILSQTIRGLDELTVLLFLSNPHGTKGIRTYVIVFLGHEGVGKSGM